MANKKLLKPELSIIVPIYNTELYLKQCINSILDQDYTNFELIIVNDGSTDNSEQICMEFVKKDKRIKYFYKTNGGLSDTRNFGISKAKGKYIAFVDSDDMINKHFCSLMMGSLKKYDADIISCNYKDFYNYDFDITEKQHLENECCFDKDNIIKEYFSPTQNQIFINVWSKIYKASLFDEIKFENYKFEDLFITYKLLNKANKLVTINNKIYFYNRSNENSLSLLLNNDKRIEERTKYIDEIISCFKNNKNLKNSLLKYVITQKAIIYNDMLSNKEKYSNELKQIKTWILDNLSNPCFNNKLRIKIILQTFYPKLFRIYRKYLVNNSK